MLKEILPDFGQDPDRDAMSMESKTIFEQIKQNILRVKSKQLDYFEPTKRKKIQVESVSINEQELL